MAAVLIKALASAGDASSPPQTSDDETARMPPRSYTVPPALRTIVLLARMRDALPPTQLASLLATFVPPTAPTAPEWTDLCSALDAYDQAAQLGLSTEEARNQVDTAAMIFHLRYDSDAPQPGSGLHEHRAVR
ncbi:hypothetical protein [Frankia sp. R43]|uniref:hypothetical protein n=1 Tax=Frankia sp. R43 TaxID=269536 RepID=UPI0006C9E9DD|nr:hypothetical protein [Frankia sp. R43]